VFHNFSKKATLEVVASGSSVANAIAAQTSLLALNRTILNITACASKPELVDSNWLVVGVKSSGSNTDASKITLSLENHDGITATPA
jgi:glucosamine 6-phosphate synthetase-like amidotransferase/phosphosugar isomerase protein